MGGFFPWCYIQGPWLISIHKPRFLTCMRAGGGQTHQGARNQLKVPSCFWEHDPHVPSPVVWQSVFHIWIIQFPMSYSHKPKTWSTPCACNFNNKVTVLIDFAFVSSWDPLWLELMRCLLYAIYGVREPLSSRSSSIGCRFECQFKDPSLVHCTTVLPCERWA